MLEVFVLCASIKHVIFKYYESVEKSDNLYYASVEKSDNLYYATVEKFG